ncbi:unnamed protein product [Cuscuta epithymum]|uniref:Patatin n=1 Tax=Cuscuta epithymum TaxID=186058 RepID=A0AAV0FV28_9ASTE|nr:unnamed protein product [Cuscuta epithymum]CAH9139454.1 unnamed protein product [Cuscuta epithymum]CAH9148997.1 unnamed protein product [Cuscuta epithymum]
MASLSSLAFSSPRPLRHQPNPNLDVRLPFTLRTSTYLNFSAKANSGQQPTPPPSETEEKKSFAVATGELFIGIASRILQRRVGGSAGIEGQGMSMFKDDPEKESYLWKRRKEEIAKVVEDPVHPEVLWEQTVKDVEAEQGWKPVTSPGFSFSAAGLLFPYHLGVAHCLIEKGYIRAVLQNSLVGLLPDDIHIRCNGRVRIAITEIFWRPRSLLVDQFDSKEDLINAVMTSSFIPGYLAPRPATMFRNRLCIDGGLTVFMPPTSASETVRVCAFPASRLGLRGVGISPDCNPENRATPRQMQLCGQKRTRWRI